MFALWALTTGRLGRSGLITTVIGAQIYAPSPKNVTHPEAFNRINTVYGIQGEVIML